MEFRVLYLKILLTEKKYNVGIYLKISEEKKNLTIFSVLMACIEKKPDCLVVFMFF